MVLVPIAAHPDELVPALYAQYVENPQPFIDALARQVAVNVLLHTEKPVSEEDLQEIHKIVETQCRVGYWRFSVSLIFLVQCATNSFLAKKASGTLE